MTEQYNGTKGLFEFIAIFLGGVIFICGVCTGVPIGEHRKISQWQKETVQRGYAEYNATTGQWQWKGEKPEVKE